jgi:hypothetical protein
MRNCSQARRILVGLKNATQDLKTQMNATADDNAPGERRANAHNFDFSASFECADAFVSVWLLSPTL